MNKRGQNSPTLFFSENRKGQVTIFIIIGIVIVSIIILFFVFKGKIIPETGGKLEKNPNAFLESCLEDKIKESVKLISLQGGFVDNPLHKSFKLESEKSPVKISYLCYTDNENVPCINQVPMLFSHLEKEISNSISDDVKDCLDKLKTSLENEGFNVESNYKGFEVNLIKEEIIIPINAEIILTKTGETSKQKDFEIRISSSLYDLALVVQEIINKEATICEFGPSDIFENPEFNIDKYSTIDSSTIYMISKNKEEFRFAVRGCI